MSDDLLTRGSRIHGIVDSACQTDDNDVRYTVPASSLP